MPTADSERRALDAIDDLIDALRIAHGAARRVENEMHGQVFEDADRMSHDIHDVRRLAEQLKREVELSVGPGAGADAVQAPFAGRSPS